MAYSHKPIFSGDLDDLPRVVDYITREQARTGFAPTTRQVARACGIASFSRVARILRKLEREGRVQYSPSRRSYKLIVP